MFWLGDSCYGVPTYLYCARTVIFSQMGQKFYSFDQVITFSVRQVHDDIQVVLKKIKNNEQNQMVWRISSPIKWTFAEHLLLNRFWCERTTEDVLYYYDINIDDGLFILSGKDVES